MKNVSVAVIIVILFLVAAFITGYSLGKKSHIVTVKIDNISQKNIASVTVEHERGTAILSDIKKKRKKKVKFYSSSENSYKLQVIFVDNTSLYSEKRNVKPGSKVIESVTEAEIKAVF